LVEKTRQEGVVFLAVADEPTKTLVAFLAKTALSARVGIDDKGATTLAYNIKSWPTTILIDPDGVIRGVMHPENLTVDLVKDLANRRPLTVRPDPAPTRPTAANPSRLDLARAGVLVYLGPPGPEVGDDLSGRHEIAGQQVDAGAIIQYCLREEAGGWYKSPRVLLECDLPARKFAYRIRVPEGSDLSPFLLLRQAVEAALGVRLRVDRESRQQDVWILRRVGPVALDSPEGNPETGRTAFGDRGIRGENSPVSHLADWIERGRPGMRVLDETGLEGKYDWILKVKSYGLDDLNDSLKKIGLAVRPAQRQVPYIVVRRSGVAKK
jgi:hypothetical protein